MSLSGQESLENPSLSESSKSEPAGKSHDDSTLLPSEVVSEGGLQEPADGKGQVERHKKHEAHKLEFELFLKSLEDLAEVEAKLQYVIDFMESSLSQGGTPHFKSFWEARNICLQLFKENIPPALRGILWDKYNDLSKEARRLKEILDEQSAFAVEQIEIAIKALEDDIAGVSENLKYTPVHFNIESAALKNTLQHYERISQELVFLNAQASRINAMRKELIRTEMRVRQKNKFFERLSQAGDKVFPRRKDLIKEVSQLFMGDVETFISSHFKDKSLESSLFALREEIKTLQNMAKLLTLNTQSFTSTRMLLSECWDKIRAEDKERKKERSLQREVFAKNFESALKMLEEFNLKYTEQKLTPGVAAKQLDELIAQMRSLELGRDEIRSLKEKVQEARKLIQDEQSAKEQEKINQDLEKEKVRRAAILELRKKVEELFQDIEPLGSEAIEERRETLISEMNLLTLTKIERQEIEKMLKPLRDIISEKQESSLMSLSDETRESLQQLKEVLKQRKLRRQEIKAQIDQLRKSAGFSGLDFEQAMNMNDQIAVEKERLEKINQGILEVEEKISHLKR